ncbi:cytochrome P450 phenylacetate hydroxylase-like protein [Byssothecium circinans]|uniref:Cytochrome P450 phenylacetate hydroxylase-like protein n=1 Tax=Byssothecium circinans TaxID=147558 RepID=A0A6A5TN14_9PLEO|nr:cytochrome P450 phenylacetate hydroxylase-like protein [Byssothecium circinans]
MTLPIIVATAAVITFFAYKFLFGTDTPHIKGLPEVPGLPLFGSLLEFGTNHAKVAQRLAEKYGPVYQVRLGNRRIVFANTFDSVRHLWITNQSALISRPTLHTFHTVVSSSQGFTIGTSPWDESCKKRRKAAATALNRPSVASYMPLIDLESNVSIKELLHDSRGGEIDLDPRAYWQRYALNTSLTLNYGYRIDGNKEDKLLKEITDVERGVSNFRSTSNNWQDYIPLLRLWSGQNKEAVRFRERRDVYMDRLLRTLKEKIEKGTDKPCITGNILKDPEAKLNEAEIKSIGLTMVSAGLDTVPGNLIMGIAYLASGPNGPAIQARAYSETLKVYPNNDAWHRCLHEEKIPYITALYKEILRYWTVIPISLPRVSIKDIEYQGVTIPAGTTFYMNAYAADYDSTHFTDPQSFNPERYLDVPDGAGTPHYGYGAGSRMCAGSHLANMELYIAFVRLISAFEFLPPRDEGDRPVMDCLEANSLPTSLTMEPKYFKVGFRPRDRGRLEEWIRGSEERTRELM